MSKLEDVNEEKLGERKCVLEYGSAGAACMLSITRSLPVMISSPSGHPLNVSFSWKEHQLTLLMFSSASQDLLLGLTSHLFLN